MGRWLATAGIAALLLLDLALPHLDLAQRGAESLVRADVEGAVGIVGEPLPELALRDLDGRPLRLADFRGHPLLITFERSVDW